MPIRPFIAITLFGFAMSVLQVTLLREALSASSGNELSLALGLTLWLLCSALGALLGGICPARFAGGVLVVVLLLTVAASFAALVTARAAFLIFQVPVGELLTTEQQLAGNALSLGPVCLLIGAAFTLACRLQSLPVSRVYFAEALGWVLGGIAATWLFVSVQPFLIFTVLAFILLLAVALIRRWAWIPATVLALGLVIALFQHLPQRLEHATLTLRWPEQRIIGDAYTPVGHGAILERFGQVALYENGRISTVMPEIETSEELAHLALLQVEMPERVFLIGALGGLLPEVLKHPVREVVVVEHDRSMTLLALTAVDDATRQALRDPRVRLVYGDGRRLLRQGPWDAVVLNIPPPSTALANRFYTAEFFQSARASLRAGGVLAFALPGSESSYGTEQIARNGSVYRALTRVFPEVAVSPLTTNYFLASAQPLCTDWRELGRRLTERHVTALLVNEYYFAAILPEAPMRELADSYRNVPALNRDLTPVAYLQQLAYEQRAEAGNTSHILQLVHEWPAWIPAIGLLAVLALFALTMATPWRRGVVSRWTMLLSVSTIGFSGMAFNILVLLIAQQALGALYHFLGLLMALGMAGIALGAWWGGRRKAAIIPTSIGLLLAVLLPVCGLLLSAWPFIPALLMLGICAFLGGVMVGMTFPLAVATGLSAGATYAADLLGAALAGLLTGILFIPVHGVVITCALLFILLLVSTFPAWKSMRHRKM